MNYAHDFHAGNFADVFKHVFLVRALLYLARKPAPLRYVETHAGSGLYDLSGERAEKTGEWRAGIGRLAEAALAADALALLAPYLDLVAPRVQGEAPTYPGSPLIARALLRGQDRLIACELHPQAFARLAEALSGDARAKAVEIDGYLGLKAFVPPPERRGLVLIDPPFEDRGEFARLAGALPAALRKWPTGAFMLWLPMKDDSAPAFLTRLGDEVKPLGRGVLRLELGITPVAQGGPLARTALVVVNPPYGFDDEARVILPELARVLGAQGASWRVDWLAPAP
ncbi:23S rRNA (adenine(2030)-N(6))-methyltransferase RlmJ [Methylocella sp.]|uniref:23S rRNA (adenine(2030)-N(6))-methyltransferase RlmJ n=1 Tax=Methylocella sp. TaxID=1978226 RepID=UPI003784637C